MTRIVMSLQLVDEYECWEGVAQEDENVFEDKNTAATFEVGA